jgi:hypothetical protein
MWNKDLEEQAAAFAEQVTVWHQCILLYLFTGNDGHGVIDGNDNRQWKYENGINN